MSTSITVVGNLAADPELRFTPGGKAVATFTVMASKSRKNEAGEWESLDTTGWTVKAWDKMAEHVAESLTKGDPVVVVGTAVWRGWEKDDGAKGGRIEVTAWHVGVDVKRNPVKILKTLRTGGTPADDVWSAPAEREDDIPPF